MGSGRSQAEDDMTWAWSSAANCLLYEEDPGPAHLNIWSETEPRWVSRSEAWMNFYAWALLYQLDTEHARLTAVAETIPGELAETTVLGWWALAVRRRQRL